MLGPLGTQIENPIPLEGLGLSGVYGLRCGGGGGGFWGFVFQGVRFRTRFLALRLHGLSFRTLGIRLLGLGAFQCKISNQQAEDKG